MGKVLIYSSIFGENVILYGDHDLPQYNDNWSAEDKRNALAYLKMLECFEFIYSLVTLSHSLLYLKEAIVKLHGKQMDLVSGVHVVWNAAVSYQE